MRFDQRVREQGENDSKAGKNLEALSDDVSQQSHKASLGEFPKPGSSRIFLYRPTIGTTGTFGTGVSL